jgi:hypothetical protein
VQDVGAGRKLELLAEQMPDPAGLDSASAMNSAIVAAGTPDSPT